jgi:hypothetical protein
MKEMIITLHIQSDDIVDHYRQLKISAAVRDQTTIGYYIVFAKIGSL